MKSINIKLFLQKLCIFVLFFVSIWFFSNSAYLRFPVFIGLFLALSVVHYLLVKRKIRTHHIVLTFLIIVFYLFVSFLSVYNNPATYLIDDLFTSFFKILIVFGLIYLFYGFLGIELYRDLLSKTLTIVLIIALLTYYIQVYLLYATGYHLDYLDLLVGREQRIFGTAGVRGIYRTSGMYNEPGSFAVSTYAILFTRYILSKKFDIFFFLGILTTLTSISVQALVSCLLLVVLFSCIYIFKSLTTMKLNIKIIFLMILAIACTMGLLYLLSDYIFLAFDYITNRFYYLSDDATLNTRLFALDQMFNNNIFVSIFGIGFNNSGLGYLIDDTGFWFSSYTMFGVPALILLIYIAKRVYKLHGSYSLIMFLILLMSKLALLNPIIALYFAAILSEGRTSNLFEKYGKSHDTE